MLGRTLDELPPQTRKLLTLLHGWVTGECERLAIKRGDWRFTRRQVRDITGSVSYTHLTLPTICSV